jgi:sortase (surface protein transpeptidase)
MDRRQVNYRQSTPVRHISVPRGRVLRTVPTREQLLATQRPQVVAQATPTEVAKPDGRVTMDNIQPKAAPQPQATPVHHQPAHPALAHQHQAYYQAQAAAHAQRVAQAEYHRQLQQQHYQRALMAARQNPAQVPMVPTGHPMPQLGGAAALPVVPAKKPSALQPYKDSLKRGAHKVKNSKLASKFKKEDGKLRPSDIVRYAVVTFFVVMASYLAFDTWNTNQQIQNVFRGDEAAASQSASADVYNPPVNEGAAYPDYQVPADQPRIISIPKISLTARVKAVGLTSSNKIDVPTDQSFAGWYSSSVAPGAEGAAFLTGHYSAGAGGVFDNLKQIAEGDTMKIEMGDGSEHEFQVVRREQVSVSAVDMAKALAPIEEGTSGLNIMTCAGNFTASGYTERLVVYTKKI